MAKIIEKHIHKLKRYSFKTGNTLYFCALPDCHFKLNPGMALGKRSICWRCGEPFIMTEYSLRLAKPHCANCHKPKVVKEHEMTEAEAKEISEVHDDINFPESRIAKQGEIPMSLSERFNKAFSQPVTEVAEIEEEDI
jgi:hypothetical protein